MKRQLIRLSLAVLVLGGLLCAALPAAAAVTGSWTAVGSTGVVDESAVPFYFTNSTALSYLPGSLVIAPIVARYNVTNTWETSDNPPWTTLEMGYFDPGATTSVRADFIQVSPCTGAQTIICTVISTDSSVQTCKDCTFPSTTVNFGSNLYYVQVTLGRTVTTVTPQLLTLKIF